MESAYNVHHTFHSSKETLCCHAIITLLDADSINTALVQVQCFLLRVFYFLPPSFFAVCSLDMKYSYNGYTIVTQFSEIWC
jgi:hypothetical protein